MTRNRAWMVLALLVALGLAVACSDSTKPKYVPPKPDSTPADSTKHPG